jgi:NAD-dependent SIR2 family protein deacetylase
MSLSVPRQQLRRVRTIEDVIESIRKAKRIVVITGAGISVSCGIPDFRSGNCNITIHIKHDLFRTNNCV